MVDKYKSGFTECANEVSRYLASIETNDVELRARLINHLANTIQRPSNNTSPVPVTLTSPTSTPITAHVRPLQIQTTPLVGQDQGSPINLSTKVASVLPEINNNTIPQSQGFMATVTSPPQTTTAKVLGGVQLIPSRLPSGEVAFVIPGNVLTASAMSNYVIPLYAGPSVAQTSPSAGSTSPTVISPPAQAVPVSLPQTPIMILPTNISRTTSPVTSESTSPDSSTNSNTTNIISLPTREQATASPTLKDSTNRNIQQQPHKAFNIEPEVQDIKLPVEQAACTDENMWRPWWPQRAMYDWMTLESHHAYLIHIMLFLLRRLCKHTL